MNFMDILKYARQSETAVQTELEHIERLHRIMKLPNRSAEYAHNLAEKLTALERRLNHSIDLAVDRKNEALNILDKLSGDERTVLYQYYILAKDWQKVAADIYMSERSVYKLRKSAIEKLETLYPTPSDTQTGIMKKAAWRVSHGNRK